MRSHSHIHAHGMKKRKKKKKSKNHSCQSTHTRTRAHTQKKKINMDVCKAAHLEVDEKNVALEVLHEQRSVAALERAARQDAPHMCTLPTGVAREAVAAVSAEQ